LKFISQKQLANFENFPQNHSENSNFRIAFFVLPHYKRVAISNFYSLCSYLDDIVDDNSEIYSVEIKKKRLNFWEKTITNFYINIIPPEISDLAKVFIDFNIPLEHILVLFDGIAADLKKNYYETIDVTLKYCYGVASIVGIICLYIFLGNGNKKNIINLSENQMNYAINLGYAMQLTNILRDIYEDVERNYIYLPQEDLKRYVYTIDDIKNKIYNENFKSLMRYEYNRAMNYYSETDILIENEDKQKLKSAELMKKIYKNLLMKIEKNDFNIYAGKISLTKKEKIKLLLGIK
jgi:phytoene synthase